MHFETHWKYYGIGTLHYNWPMSAHASQAFSTYTSARDCTDSKHLPTHLLTLHCTE